ncbi:MAG: metallophosphatase family protein [Lachnospiraceae bacterium]|nr:metallophosphatase family protein [Lachnospiraceae bacterium]
MRIAVISDTHDVLREEVLEQIRRSDAVIHAGDVSSMELVERIRENTQKDAALYLVRGNADGDWAGNIPETQEITLEQVRIFVVHDRKKAVVPEHCNIVISGHTHKYQEETIDGRLWLNPGGCGRRRFQLELTMAILYIEERTWRVEKMVIEPRKSSLESGTDKERTLDAAADEARGKKADTAKENRMNAAAETLNSEITPNPLDLSSGELLRLIERILAGMKRGRTIAQIAGELNLEASFVEEICRIYVTHPGVTANGILDKLEVNRHIEA